MLNYQSLSIVIHTYMAKHKTSAIK